ncbi:TIGR03885 family FMN-dependent LLM class oxidoreductase [Microbacterium saccharophilum]|uniref:TIGR03885 family FMN-dependent LLM class oxidoreductase n=1 Tax=Microbacterium saccharophilum TaxID=1213358 RepID=A0A5C8HXX6_9MICO|nr:TIGR03885 family FMN-dependent LLM class oxidoreductase [Microbacterium saccharophilum]TXK11367.1 TIGR03885 family FMN-dependent LLM class oxidoreductase [Microbacterium saccharophilum]GEP48825.1 LLM class F420-dependent oxidoreductase [Microbacterium saccharophilum]
MVLIGFHASHEQLPPGALLDAVVRAEQAGFDGAMCSDHLAPWGVRQGESGYAWSWLGAALASTSFSLGVVTAPGQRYHPVITAQAIATLEEMFPGRFWAALGSGEAMNEHVTGDAWPPKSRRNERLAQSVEVIRALLAGEEVTRSGEIEVHRARVWSRPSAPPPLLGAAVTAETAAWVAGWANGLATVAQPPDVLAGVIQAYRDADGPGPRVLQVHIALEDTDDAALAVTRDQWRHSVIRRSLWDIEQPEDFDALAGDPTDEELRNGALVGSDGVQIAERIAALVRLGFDRVYIHSIGPDQAAFLERAERELLPALRRSL